MYRFIEDESFDDLAETEPNWINSLTESERCSDIDSDLNLSNFSMLKPTYNDNNSADPVKENNITTTSHTKRDLLLEKLNTFKLKTSSLSADNEESADKPNAALVAPVHDEHLLVSRPLSKSLASLIGGTTLSPTAARHRSMMPSLVGEPSQALKTLKSSLRTILKPNSKNDQVHVKESFSARSLAPLKTIAPMNRIARTRIPSLVSSSPKFPVSKLMQPSTSRGKDS